MNVKFKWMNGTKTDSNTTTRKLVMVNVKEHRHIVVATIINAGSGYYLYLIGRSYPKKGFYAALETAMNNAEKLFGLTDIDFIKPAKRPRPMVTGKSSKK